MFLENDSQEKKVMSVSVHCKARPEKLLTHFIHSIEINFQSIFKCSLHLKYLKTKLVPLLVHHGI